MTAHTYVAPGFCAKMNADCAEEIQELLQFEEGRRTTQAATFYRGTSS